MNRLWRKCGLPTPLALLATLAMVGCGGGLQGRYESNEALIAVEFKSHDKANFEYPMMPVVEVDYEVSGKEIKLKTPLLGTIVGTIADSGCLVFGGVYGTICKLEGGRSSRSPIERDALSAMKRDLRNLVTAQEAYFSEHERYGEKMTALEFGGSPGVTITLAGVTSKGWTATATHRSTAETCVLTLVESDSKTEGEPICH